MSLVSANQRSSMKLTYEQSEDYVAVSAEGVPWMPPMCVLVVKLWESRIQVWVVNRMTNTWSLYAESTILNNTRGTNETSGSDMELTPSD
jgi:hypothetical protein